MNILVLAAHPDDEVLGCGGTILKHVKNGDEVHVVILAEGVTSRSDGRNKEQHEEKLAELADAAVRANDVLGVSSLTLLKFPDNRMDSVDLLDVVKVVEGIIDKLQPKVIYTHHAGDVNVDHCVLNKAVITACRPIPGHLVEDILFFEIPSSTEWQVPGSAPVFAPNWFVDVTETMSTKLEALRAYASEMRDWPHPRSDKAVAHLASWRGACIGTEAAEAFVLGRRIMK